MKVKTIIDIEDDVFNEIYEPIHEKYKELPRKIFYGGRNSGKTHYIAQRLVLDCIENKYFRCLLVRRTYNTIKNSQWQAIKDVVEDWGLEQFFVFTKNPLEIHCTINGNFFIAKGLDDPRKAKSVANPTVAWFEEAEEITEEQHRVLSMSLRSAKVKHVEEYISFNPPKTGADFWIIKKYFGENWREYEQHDGMHTIMPAKSYEGMKQDTVIMHSCYHHNEYVSNQKKREFKQLEIDDYETYQLEGLGLIRKQIKNRFWYKFNANSHVDSSINYDPKLVNVHNSYDENYLPYLTCLIFQIYVIETTHQYTHYGINLIDENCTVPPDSYFKENCEAFKRKYPRQKINGYVYFYGDSNMKSRTARSKENGFGQIIKGLSGYLKTGNGSNRALRGNPSIATSASFVNTLISGEVVGNVKVTFKVNPRCVLMIRDFDECQPDANGAMVKKKTLVNGERVEEIGHCSDALRYFFVGAFPSSYMKFKRGS